MTVSRSTSVTAAAGMQRGRALLRQIVTGAQEAFVTEVHHITEEGENKGVVYCEMQVSTTQAPHAPWITELNCTEHRGAQGRENDAESLVDRACLDLLYSDPLCGYSSETGGTMVQLRGCSNSAIKRCWALAATLTSTSPSTSALFSKIHHFTLDHSASHQH